MRNIIVLCLIVVTAMVMQAQVKISGDARVRPRYDINDKTPGGGSKTTDLYYMYRARLNVHSDIDNGWFFHTLLAHNGIFDYSVFGKGDYPDVLGANQNTAAPSSNESARRATLSFMELYFGREIKEYGFRLGLIPLGSIANPMYDLHYYPAKMVDIPYAIFNTDGAFGASAYLQTDLGKFGLKVLVEDQRGYGEELANGTEVRNLHDQYTFELNYSATMAGFTVSPMLMLSIAQDSVPAPNTFGFTVATPKLMDLTPSVTFGYTQQSHDAIGIIRNPGMPSREYNAWLFRAKLAGPLSGGNLLAWVDVAKRTETFSNIDTEYDYLFFWVGYEIFMYKSDKGSFSITPEIRYATEKIASKESFSRLKTEVNIDIKF